MVAQYLVFFYMLICVMMTVFNFGFLFYEKVHTKRFEKKMDRMAAGLAAEIERNADFPTEAHRHILEHAMRFLSGMESFDLSMDKLRGLDAEKSEHYLRGISSVFEHLTYHFQRKDDLKCAYFAYIVGRWYRKRPCADVVKEALLHYVRERSFYARQNALQALSALGDAKALVDAAEALDREDSFHHPKLVTEAFLAFEGDQRELENEAIARFASLHPALQAAVVNYVRMADVGGSPGNEQCAARNRAWALGLLKDESANVEVRLACIRYFMRHPWSEAEETLLELSRRDTPEEWEFAAVSASALAAYPGDESRAALKRCLRSPLWHVRHNAAKSLHSMGLSLEEDLADVMEGDDPYARDMLQYRWEYEAMRAGKDETADGSAQAEDVVADCASAPSADGRDGDAR